MAKQLDLQLTQVVCVASVLSLGGATKASLETLEKDIRPLVAARETKTT